MALDRRGRAVFFARSGAAVASAPPLPETKLPLPPLPSPPPLPPGEMYNGAARLLDSAIPWEIEAAAREAVEAGEVGEAGREPGKAGGEPGEAVERAGRADDADLGTGSRREVLDCRRREDPDRRRRKDTPPPPAQAA